MTSARRSNSLGVYMGYLRRKTEVGGEPRLLHTVRGVGYVLRDAAMSFRRRITLVSAAAVAIAVVLASLLTYVLTSDQLHSQVDTQLRNRGGRRLRVRRARRPVQAPLAAIAAERSLGSGPDRGAAACARPERPAQHRQLFGKLPPRPDQVRGYQQVVERRRQRSLARSATGRVAARSTRARARWRRHGGEPFFRDAHVNGIHLRVLAEPLGRGRAVQFAQPLTEVDSLLRPPAPDPGAAGRRRDRARGAARAPGRGRRGACR